MEFLPSRLSRVQSDAMVDRIQQHFSEHNFGLWAVEVPDVATFIGFTGLAVPRFRAHFTPCVEVGWRLAFEYWGQGYATEAARLALGYGFGNLALSEVLSFTSTTNHRSQAVMERLGMHRDPAGDFDHPALPDNHPFRRHVLFRLDSDSLLTSVYGRHLDRPPSLSGHCRRTGPAGLPGPGGFITPRSGQHADSAVSSSRWRGRVAAGLGTHRHWRMWPPARRECP